MAQECQADMSCAGLENRTPSIATSQVCGSKQESSQLFRSQRTLKNTDSRCWLTQHHSCVYCRPVCFCVGLVPHQRACRTACTNTTISVVRCTYHSATQAAALLHWQRLRHTTENFRNSHRCDEVDAQVVVTQSVHPANPSTIQSCDSPKLGIRAWVRTAKNFVSATAQLGVFCGAVKAADNSTHRNMPRLVGGRSLMRSREIHSSLWAGISEGCSRCCTGRVFNASSCRLLKGRVYNATLMKRRRTCMRCAARLHAACGCNACPVCYYGHRLSWGSLHTFRVSLVLLVVSQVQMQAALREALQDVRPDHLEAATEAAPAADLRPLPSAEHLAGEAILLPAGFTA